MQPTKATQRVQQLTNHLTHATTTAVTAESTAKEEKRANVVETSGFVQGNFAPIAAEHYVENLQVLSGKIPTDLDGQFVRNGPNPQFNFESKPYMWFDGDGHLHAINIQNGRASYINRFIQTERLISDRRRGSGISEIGEMSYGNFEALSTAQNENNERMGRANTALIFHSKKALALEEGDKPYVIKLPMLETVGKYTFDGKLTHSVTAHPIVDRKTGEMMFFGYELMQPPWVYYSVVDAQGQLLRTVSIDIRAPIMMHSFAVTEHYSIIMDLPLQFQVSNAFEGKDIFVLEEVGSRFGIIPRHATSTDQVRWFDAETCMIFHTANAWEEGDEVVLYACRSRKFKFGFVNPIGGKSPKLPESQRSFLWEYRFNLTTGKTKERQVMNEWVEFPVVDVSRMGYKSRYIYAARFTHHETGLPHMDGIVKYDVDTGKALVHLHHGKFAGECVFAPRTNQKAEDDGYLVTFRHDEQTNQSDFVIINAQTMDAEPVCTLATGSRVPYGFHGWWFNREQIKSQAA